MSDQRPVRLVPVDLAVRFASSPVALDPLAAAALAPHVRLAIRRLLRNGAVVSPALRRALEALEAAERAMLELEQASVEPGTTGLVSSQPSQGFPGAPSGCQFTAAEVAALAGVSVQAVTKAARRRRLAARLHRGRWLIPEDAARTWVAGREDRERATDPTPTGDRRRCRHDEGLPDHGHEAPGDPRG